MIINSQEYRNIVQNKYVREGNITDSSVETDRVKNLDLERKLVQKILDENSYQNEQNALENFLKNQKKKTSGLVFGRIEDSILKLAQSVGFENFSYKFVSEKKTSYSESKMIIASNFLYFRLLLQIAITPPKPYRIVFPVSIKNITISELSFICNEIFDQPFWNIKISTSLETIIISPNYLDNFQAHIDDLTRIDMKNHEVCLLEVF